MGYRRGAPVHLETKSAILYIFLRTYYTTWIGIDIASFISGTEIFVIRIHLDGFCSVCIREN
jgi:hypothetical protein